MGEQSAMSAASPYEEAHLFVAAIRVLADRHGRPPTVEAVCEFLDRTLEWGRLLCRRLADRGIIEPVDDPFTTTLFIADHLKIEQLERQAAESGLARELERFQRERKDVAAKVDAIAAERDRKKRDLFAELDRRLRGERPLGDER